MKRGSKYNFQRVYPYVCKCCKKKRGTRLFNRREDELCTLCRKKEIDKNQGVLFPEDEQVLGVLEVEKTDSKQTIDKDIKVIDN